MTKFEKELAEGYRCVNRMWVAGIFYPVNDPEYNRMVDDRRNDGTRRNKRRRPATDRI